MRKDEFKRKLATLTKNLNEKKKQEDLEKQRQKFIQEQEKLNVPSEDEIMNLYKLWTTGQCGQLSDEIKNSIQL